MEIITRDVLNDLSELSGHNLISLYMPTHRTGRELQQDPIRYKNLLTKAEQHLTEMGLRFPEINSLLDNARKLQLDAEFWQHQSDGLAIFASEDSLRYYRLPINFEELLIIGNRFHLKPLLPLLSRNGHFFVLAFSQKKVRLLEGSLFSINEVDIEEVPASLQEALWFDDPEKQLQFHTGTTSPSNAGSRPASYHGQGINEDDTKTELLRYFQKVDNGLTDILGDENAPLILAGVDYLLPIYHQANNYPHLVEEGIEGNPDELSAVDLHKQAWDILEPIFSADLDHALIRYQELSGSESNLASADMNTIIPAAHYGRLDILFVALGIQLWGSFDAENNILKQHQEYQPGDLDLFDLTAIKTLINGGTVFALEPGQMPSENPLAAIFRYAYDG